MGWIIKLLAKLNTDGHIAVGVLVFLIGAGIHVFHGLDASFVAFSSTVLAFLGGHSYVQSQTPAPPADGGQDGRK